MTSYFTLYHMCTCVHDSPGGVTCVCFVQIGAFSLSSHMMQVPYFTAKVHVPLLRAYQAAKLCY